MIGSNIKPTYKQTILRYNELREAVYEFSESQFRGAGVKFTEILYKDVVDADAWYWKNEKKNPIWEWKRMYHDYHSHAGIKRFEIALRYQGKLCALCYGVPSRKKLILKLHALSRQPMNNPLSGKVLGMILFSADAYARLIGSQEMWLCNPMNKQLVDLYKKEGFKPHYNNIGTTTHLSMRIES